MDFSFFRKAKNKLTPARKTGKEAAIEAIDLPPLTEQRFDTDVSQGGIEVVETGARLAPGIEEAAMLYANGRAQEAIATLKACLDTSQQDDAVWRMLFDLYRVTRQRDAFEQLALDFAVRRETSPPVWVESEAKARPQHGAQSPMPAPGGQLFSLRGTLDEASADRIQLLVEAAAKGAIQLDLSGISGLTAQGCMLLKDALARLQKNRAQLQIASGALVNLLLHSIRDGGAREPAHWLLLLQLYQVQGKQAEFEDLAVEYAVNFEVSPPSWESPGRVAQSVAPVASLEAEDTAADPDAFPMSGVISGASAPAFADFQAFAKSRSEVVLDLSAVARVEFASINLFMDALMALLQVGKRVRIIGANEMVITLLVVMGVDQMAEIVRRKAG